MGRRLFGAVITLRQAPPGALQISAFDGICLFGAGAEVAVAAPRIIILLHRFGAPPCVALTSCSGEANDQDSFEFDYDGKGGAASA